jgi:hypothetical protein
MKSQFPNGFLEDRRSPLGEVIGLLISLDVTVGGNPLEGHFIWKFLKQSPASKNTRVLNLHIRRMSPECRNRVREDHSSFERVLSNEKLFD